MRSGDEKPIGRQITLPQFAVVVPSVAGTLTAAFLAWLVITTNSSAHSVDKLSESMLSLRSQQTEFLTTQRIMRDDILLFSSTYVTKEDLQKRLETLRREMDVISARLAVLEKVRTSGRP